MVPALRPGLDQRALVVGGSTAEQDPTASGGLQPFSLRSTDRRQDGGAVGGARIPLIVPCVHRNMGVSPCAAARRRSRFVPAHGSRQTGAKPLACGICHVPCLLPVLPVPGDGGAFLRVRCRRYRHSQGER